MALCVQVVFGGVIWMCLDGLHVACSPCVRLPRDRFFLVVLVIVYWDFSRHISKVSVQFKKIRITIVYKEKNSFG